MPRNRVPRTRQASHHRQERVYRLRKDAITARIGRYQSLACPQYLATFRSAGFVCVKTLVSALRMHACSGDRSKVESSDTLAQYETHMKKSRFTKHPIVGILEQAAVAVPVESCLHGDLLPLEVGVRRHG